MRILEIDMPAHSGRDSGRKGKHIKKKEGPEDCKNGIDQVKPFLLSEIKQQRYNCRQHESETDNRTRDIWN